MEEKQRYALFIALPLLYGPSTSSHGCCYVRVQMGMSLHPLTTNKRLPPQHLFTTRAHKRAVCPAPRLCRQIWAVNRLLACAAISHRFWAHSPPPLFLPPLLLLLLPPRRRRGDRACLRPTLPSPTVMCTSNCPNRRAVQHLQLSHNT
jgi:hypothetical protein